MKTVVIDTNVWVSALQFQNSLSAPFRAVQLAFQADRIATCDEIEAELWRILVGKFLWTEARFASLLQKMLTNSQRVNLHHSVKVCRDPNDDIFLECAQRASADLIIAGDKDLLVLGTFAGAKIVTPAEYLQLPR